MPLCDVDHGVIKCSVPGNESRFLNYVKGKHVSVLLLMLWTFVLSERK